MASAQAQKRDIRHGDYLLSTDRKHIDIDALNDAFSSEWMWWATPLPGDVLRATVENSLCFGAYLCNTHDMVGFSRLVTDYTTFAYLTDVYILPSHRGRGLASALMQLVNDVVEEWPHLRRIILFASNPRAEKLYVDVLKMQDMWEGDIAAMTLYERAGPGVSKKSVV